jgi:hypothetical protein
MIHMIRIFKATYAGHKAHLEDFTTAALSGGYALTAHFLLLETSTDS